MAVTTEEFKGTPAVRIKAPSQPQYRASKLPSGITLASRATDSPVVGISVTVQTGSRDESYNQRGSSFMLKHLAFQDTVDRSAFTLLRDLQDIGATVRSSVCRETLTFKVEVLRDHVEAAVAALADTLIHPYLPEWILKENKPVALLDVNHYAECTQTAIVEMLHEAAFGEATPLGGTLYSACNVKALTLENLLEFRNKAFVADNLVIAANGVDHSTLTNLTETYFKGCRTGKLVPASSTYLGGESRVKAAPPMTHIALGFPGAAFAKDGFDTSEVLAAVLKARVQKDFRCANTLARGYHDVGLVGLTGTVKTADASKLASAMTSAVTGVANGVTEEEVKRAKVKISLQRTLDHEHSTCTYAMTRAAAKGLDPVTFAQGPRQVTREAVQKAAQGMLKAKPAYAVLGPTARVPRIDDITKMLKQA